jgi:hypothetical protein
MADSFSPRTSLVDINNRGTDATSSPTTVAAKLQVVDGRLVADDRMTDPGVLV